MGDLTLDFVRAEVSKPGNALRYLRANGVKRTVLRPDPILALAAILVASAELSFNSHTRAKRQLVGNKTRIVIGNSRIWWLTVHSYIYRVVALNKCGSYKRIPVCNY